MSEANNVPEAEPMRCVIVVDAALPAGRAANVAAVVALTLGKRQPQLAGRDLADATGELHPGLVAIGVPVLAGTADALRTLRAKAVAAGLEVVDFPAPGQATTDYEAFCAAVAATLAESLDYVAVGVFGGRKAVGKLVGKFALFK